MALNERQREALEDLLATKATGGCRMCGATDWAIDDRTLYVSDSPTEMGMFAMEVVPVGCRNCGNVVMFSTRVVKQLPE
jgi:hypothetical protein